VLIVGGRHLGDRAEPDAALTLSAGSRVLDSWTVSPVQRFFLRLVPLPPGTLMAGEVFTRVEVRSAAADGSGRRTSVALEQFDVQPEGSVVYGFDAGWHEQEYDPSTGLMWRWSSERADTRVHHGGRDLTVTIRGESPLRYFSSAPEVVVRAGSRILLRSAPSGDFVLEGLVPAAALDAAAGILTLETNEVFVPAERSASPDRRHLGLRILSFNLAPAH
jgi:hypothetical protein